MKKKILLFILLLSFQEVFGQEVINSIESDYFNFLVLDGKIDRPYMNYQTLSDLNYTDNQFSEVNHIWSNNKLDATYYIFDNQLRIKVFQPEMYNSYNTKAPFGQNDGALWQGKGYNFNITTGLFAEFKGFNVSFKPSLSFSQNKDFAYPTPNYSGDIYTNKAAVFGDYSLGNIDAPQRFGTNPFFTFDWGDSELRYTWNNLTLGFGTEYLWLGPSKINPIIHSNNAPTYPKFDFGIKKQSLEINDLWLGNIEFRYWFGKLHESNYFDNTTSNDNNLITGLALAYEIPFIPNLTIGLNRTMLSKWNNKSKYTMWTLLIPYMKTKAGYDESDQRASIFADYLIPEGGIDIYVEWGKNDYNSGFDNLMRYPFHTQAITAGFTKNIEYNKLPNLFSQLQFEISFLESSMDYHFFYDWGGSGNDFYSHHLITQGYTNKGQYLGAGIGAGGNSQYISYKFIYPKGSTTLSFQRYNPDLNYFYFLAPRNTSSSNPNGDIKKSINVHFICGISNTHYFTSSLRTQTSFYLDDEHNPLLTNRNLLKDPSTKKSEHRYNFVFQFGIKYFI